MRFSTVHVALLATASCALAAPAPSRESALSNSVPDRLRINVGQPEHHLKSGRSSPMASPISPKSPFSPSGFRDPRFKGAETITEPERFRKASRKYCTGSQRHAILCSQKSSKDLVTKLMKSKSPFVEKELALTLDLARAFMEEHGTQTALAMRKHIQYRTADHLSKQRLETETENLLSGKVASKLKPAATTNKAKKLPRRSFEDEMVMLEKRLFMGELEELD